MKGGKLPVKTLKKLIQASGTYDPENDTIDDWKLDKELSNSYGQVYSNKNNNRAVVVHRQTKTTYDILDDLGLITNDKTGDRFKIAEIVQKNAENRYKPENITVVGYSLGGLLGPEYASDDVHEIITLNRPVLPSDIRTKPNKKHFNIKASRDPVSILSYLQPNDPNEIKIQSTSFNPFREHSVDVLDRLDEEQQIGHGKGRSGKCKPKK